MEKYPVKKTTHELDDKTKTLEEMRKYEKLGGMWLPDAARKAREAGLEDKAQELFNEAITERESGPWIKRDSHMAARLSEEAGQIKRAIENYKKSASEESWLSYVLGGEGYELEDALELAKKHGLTEEATELEGLLSKNPRQGRRKKKNEPESNNVGDMAEPILDATSYVGLGYTIGWAALELYKYLI